jgi:hypothetical protein
LDLLKLLRTARWLSTSQVQRRFFPLATADAVRKRLRKLTVSGYLIQIRRDRMSEALFAVGPQGKRTLEAMTAEHLTLERKPPAQMAHSTAINDLRISAELAGGLQYFYSAWELPSIGWKQPLIPDGVAAFNGKTFAIEYDSGAEGVRFFVRSKMIHYEHGLAGFPITAVLVVVDRLPRLLSLAKAIGDRRVKVLFTTLDLVHRHDFLAPIWFSEPHGWGAGPLGNVSCQSVAATGDFPAPKSPAISDLGPLQPSLLRQRGAEHGKACD